MNLKNLSIKYIYAKIKSLINIAYETPYFLLIIILNFFSSFLTILGIPLLVPALQFLQNNNLEENKYIDYLNILFDFFKIDLNFFSIIITSSLLIFLGQVVLLLIELFSKKIQINLKKKYTLSMINNYYGVNWQWMLEDKSGKFQSTISREIEATSEAHLDSLRVITNFFQITFFIFSSFLISFTGSILAIIFFFITLMINSLFSKKLNDTSKSNNESNIRLLSLINSIIQNKKFLKSSKNFENFSNQINYEVDLLNDSSWKLSLIDGSLRTFSYLFGILFMVLIFIFHKKLNINFSEILVLLLIFSRLIPLFSQLISNFNRVLERQPIYISVNGRINELLKNQEINGQKIVYFRNSIQFKNVNFEYKKNISILNNINLKIENKKSTFIVGPSGSGKSTLLDMLLGLIKANKGEVFIDNISIKDVDLNEFRKNIAYVSQDTTFVDGSIIFNLKLSNQKTSMNEIIQICKKVQIYDFIKNLPESFNSNIGENGINLSGGQRQRLAIARALINKPRLLILDEATSNLDLLNEFHINEAINEIKKDIAIVIVTHRFSSIKFADQIYLLEKGKITESGRYFDLVNKKGRLYKYENLSNSMDE